MEKYRVVSPIKHAGKRCEVDSTVEMDVGAATPLLAAGVIAEPEASAKQPAAQGEARVRLIKAAIAGLDKANKALFNADGVTPKPDAISKAIGWPVSAAERDEVMKTDEPPAAPEGEERVNLIKAAVDGLDKENAALFAEDGATPTVEAIAKVTGWEVTAEERDTAIQAAE